MIVCVCVCARARARAPVCLCVRACEREPSEQPVPQNIGAGARGCFSGNATAHLARHLVRLLCVCVCVCVCLSVSVCGCVCVCLRVFLGTLLPTSLGTGSASFLVIIPTLSMSTCCFSFFPKFSIFPSPFFSVSPKLVSKGTCECVRKMCACADVRAVALTHTRTRTHAKTRTQRERARAAIQRKPRAMRAAYYQPFAYILHPNP